MKTLYYLIWLIPFLLCTQIEAQQQGKVHFTPELKTLLEERALSRMKDFQKLCQIISSQSHLSESAQKDALDLFVDKERTIRVTDGRGRTKKPVRIETYLRNLSRLPYSKIKITSADFRIATNIHPSIKMNELHPGEDWYEGTCTVIQRFYGESDKFEYIDVVQRKFTVYMKKSSLYFRGKNRDSWQVLLGDIDAQVISVGR